VVAREAYAVWLASDDAPAESDPRPTVEVLRDGCVWAVDVSAERYCDGDPMGEDGGASDALAWILSDALSAAGFVVAEAV
jgi:hypothetical protein